MFRACVITMSDTCSKGIKADTSGPKICEILKDNNYEIIETKIVSDDKEDIKKALLHCVDELKVDMVVTTGGTGFAERDNTPEVTKEIVEKEVPGIPELMRYESMKITSKACLSRAYAGIRKKTLIINLPGSEKAAKENLLAVIEPIEHGLNILKGTDTFCGEQENVKR